MIEAFGIEWRPSPYLAPTFLAGGMAAALAAYAWQHREKRAARPFVVLMAGLVIWSVGYGLELGFASVGPMLWFDKIAFVGSVIAPTAWFVLAIEYAGYEEWLSRRTLAALAVEPVAVLGFVWTNEVHGLVWADTGLDASGPLTVPDLTFGPAYWANYAYSYVLVAGALVILVSVAVRANRIHRRQSLFLIVGMVVPLGANLAFHQFPSLNPIPNLDLTSFAFTVTGLAFALALFRYRMLDLVPVARERLVERMDDGVVVLAADGSVVDRNPAARRVLDDAAVGTAVTETAIGNADGGVVEGYVSIEVGGEERSFDVSATSISDFRGEAAGHFVVMRDITELQILRAHEQRLSVLNRLLRHNIRNELNVITGRSELLADDIKGPQREHLSAIDRATERILTISDQARYVDMTVADDTDHEPVDLAAVCDEAVASLRSAYPDAEIAGEWPDSAWIRGIRREHVGRLVEELVENGVVHNEGSPRVSIDVEQRDRTVRLVVADDGPGIPSVEQGILDRERETPLEHGTGFGLWLVKWIVDAAGGEISFSGDEDEGSIVVVTLPRAVDTR